MEAIETYVRFDLLEPFVGNVVIVELARHRQVFVRLRPLTQKPVNTFTRVVKGSGFKKSRFKPNFCEN